MFIIDKEIYLRLGFFFSILFVMAMWEIAAPRRVLTTEKKTRWFINLFITFSNAVILRLIFPAAPAGIALVAAKHGWGIFNMTGTHSILSIILPIFILDLTIWFQHVSFHRIRFFWRFHMMHHTDLDIDVTTGARFHPVEIVLSVIIKIIMIILIGPPVLSVIVFEIVLNGSSMFNHSNALIPGNFDRILRKIVVTPDMHRVHHSMRTLETNSNFGFNFPWWDRLFGTYIDQPSAGHEEMTIGLADYRDEKYLTLLNILSLPFYIQK